jgi:hypothetical protein
MPVDAMVHAVVLVSGPMTNLQRKDPGEGGYCLHVHQDHSVAGFQPELSVEM